MVLPIKFSFYEDGMFPVWDYIDTGVDCVFYLDFILTFFTAYWDGERLVVSLKSIAVNYLKFWFWMDILSIFPFEYILDSGGNKLVLVRISRLPRLYRLVRIIRVFRTIKITRDQNNIWAQLHDCLKLSPSNMY